MPFFLFQGCKEQPFDKCSRFNLAPEADIDTCCSGFILLLLFPFTFFLGSGGQIPVFIGWNVCPRRPNPCLSSDTGSLAMSDILYIPPVSASSVPEASYY